MKFRYSNGLDQALLVQGAKFLGEKTFVDVYLDNPKLDLTCKNIWFRKREKSYECKFGSRDVHGVDNYKELSEEEDIGKFLETITHTKFVKGHFEEFLHASQITPFGSIKTHRKKLLLEEFGIDLDETDFGYRLGEVELLVDDHETAKEKRSCYQNQEFLSKITFGHNTTNSWKDY